MKPQAFGKLLPWLLHLRKTTTIQFFLKFEVVRNFILRYQGVNNLDITRYTALAGTAERSENGEWGLNRAKEKRMGVWRLLDKNIFESCPFRK